MNTNAKSSTLADDESANSDDTPRNSATSHSSNNLKSICNNYSNMSSDTDEADDSTKVASTPDEATSSQFKILTAFVPYKNRFIHDKESSGDDEENDAASKIQPQDIATQSNSKRQKSDEFGAASRKTYRSKNSPSNKTSVENRLLLFLFVC